MTRVLCLGLALVALIPDSAQAKPSPLPGLVTPSGNIRCFYVPARPGHLLCDIHRAAYSQREQNSCMARSGLDWHGWEVYAARPTTTVCSGGILYNSNRNVPVYRRRAYGSTWRFAAFTCTSRISGSKASPARRARGTASSSRASPGAAGNSTRLAG